MASENHSGFPDDVSEHSESDVSRRDFCKTAGILTGAVALGMPVFPPEVSTHAAQSGTPANNTPLEITINGTHHSLILDPRVTLLDVLRENLGLTGTKKGCDHGQCGACTVLANGRRINSCLSLAVTHDGDEIITIEGIADADNLHPVQAAFVEFDGFQCGYCTPGQICSAVALLAEAKRGDASSITRDLAKSGAVDLTEDEVRERMSGNICRCGAYPGIVEAVRAAYRST